MNFKNLKSWLDLTQVYQSDLFWKQVIEGNDQVLSIPKNESPPKYDLYTFKNSLVIEAEIPGMDSEDVQVQLKDGYLILSGEFNTLSPQRTYYVKERCNQKFEKKIPLPHPINNTEIKKEARNGLLSIYLSLKSIGEGNFFE
ncbi:MULTISPECIES: Hsp20/alpha crystallin family protein [unclassified Bacillus (in: firmicutes)]|uniref:Hsp20/alpha crystallin family protein n=1 Tax=unclassified Bacillus (in: firmicutes) TaxID=185979 RepID=UPI0008E08237|nr:MULTISPECIES: Hsp20/alpha crystallin family protein [unclassified Bacillus (in: firmicutes)]SFA91909.1 HSP20 family protein [Bacillus sp. UNCCL13]SFQ85716.1 HSP20 family protein [Bacillus sp. cl95]